MRIDRWLDRIVVAALIVTLVAVLARADRGVYGFGGEAVGGAGGEMVMVSCADDTLEPGTLRHAVEVLRGPRRIQFESEAREITLAKHLLLTGPDDAHVTISGVTLRGYGIYLLDTEQVIIRNVRVLCGETPARDGISIKNSRDVIVHQCTALWATDECLSTSGSSERITVQQSLIGECRLPHSSGSLNRDGAGPAGVSYIRCLFAGSAKRNPRLCNGAQSGEPPADELVNSIVYGWSSYGVEIGRTEGFPTRFPRVNLVGNWFLPGPATPARYSLGIAADINISDGALHIDGNLPDDGASAYDLAQPGARLELPLSKRAPGPFASSTPVLPVRDAILNVIDNVGAHPRGPEERRILADVMTRRGQIGIPETQPE